MKKLILRKQSFRPIIKFRWFFSLTNGVPTYAVNFKKRPVILSSALGFELKDGTIDRRVSRCLMQRHRPRMKRGLSHGANKGKCATIMMNWQSHCSRPVIRDVNCGIVFRVFDDAIAFRYEWPSRRRSQISISWTN